MLSRLDEASKDINTVLASGDLNVKKMAIDHRAFLELFQKSWDAAEKDFRDAAQLNKNRATGELENIGLIYIGQNKWKEALDWSIEMETKGDGSGGWMWLTEAIAADKLGRMDQRILAVEKFKRHYIDEVAVDPLTEFDEIAAFLPKDVADIARGWLGSKP